MKKGAKGVWRTTVELAPGTHHYRFFVDGEWHDDPECILRLPNPFGGENMVRQVRASATA
jgi:1,4-alpha-glucan branching enzyme